MRPAPRTSRSFPDARYVVTPAGIVSSGFPSVQQTCAEVGIHFDPWQVDLNRLILAKDATGLYAADTVALSIARQVGKTFDIGALVFADSIVNAGTTTVWTAHRFKVARETFNELRGLAKSPLLAPHLEYEDITTAAGNEMIPFRNGSRIVFAARERGAIRGFTKVRRIILDEAQILTAATMADLAPTMNQAANPQMILMGTPPKPSDPGETFTGLRLEALAGESEGLLYVELAADPDADLDDRRAWRQANPSYPHRTPDRAIMRLRKLLSDENFSREALGIWDEANSNAAIDPTRWATLVDPQAERGSAPTFGLATAPDRSWAAIAAAWKRPDGSVQVSVADYRQGTSWVAERATELRARWGGRLLCDTPSDGLVPDAVRLSAGDQAKAHNALSDAVEASTVRHYGDAEKELVTSVRAARWKTSGDTRVLDARGSTDISPLRAAALAMHGLATAPTSSGWMVSLP
jgi:hypothetical protein